MRLVIPQPFKRELATKPADLQGAILRAVNQLGQNPRHPGLRTHRVRGTTGIWQARVDRSNRVTFEYGGQGIVLRKHCNHDILRSP
jgi:mRNA interferase RelE/StbE